MELIRQLIECESFDSPEGSSLVTAGRKALQAGLPKRFEPSLVFKLYDRYLRDAPYQLWRVLHKTKREHAIALRDALRLHRSLQSDYLLAAIGACDSIDDAAFDRLLRATKALAKIHSFSFAATSVAASRRVEFVAAQEDLVAAIVAAMLPRVSEKENTVEYLVWLWFVSVLAQRPTDGSLAVLRGLAVTARKRGEVEVLARLLRYHADADANVAALVSELDAVTHTKIEAAGSAPLTRLLSLTRSDWQVEVLVGTDPDKQLKRKDYPYPFAMLRAHRGLPPRTWKVRVQTQEAYTLHEEGEESRVQIPVPAPANILDVHDWFARAEKVLNVRWVWSRAAIATNLIGDERKRFVSWIRRGN